MTQPSSLYLIDGTAFIYRAFHAIRNLTNDQGLPTNAVFGFSRMLIQLVREHTPDYVAVCFDAKGPTFRHEMYDLYKANRPPMLEDMAIQIPWIKQVVEGFRMPVVELAGFEADDLMGTLAHQAEAAGFDVTLVTGDKDFKQLVTDRIRIWDPMKDKTITPATVLEEFGLTPGQLVDVMGFSGDTADNVPGVPGIGPKTAVKLIQKFGDMAAVYAQIDTLPANKQREKLMANETQARLSRDLVVIRTDAPVTFNADECKAVAPDGDALGAVFSELGFRQLQQTFQSGQSQPEKTYGAITTEAELTALVARLTGAALVAVDTETTSQHPMQADLVGISISIQPHVGWYVPVGHTVEAAPTQLPMERVLGALAPILTDPAIAKVGQNIKYDWIVLARHGLVMDGVAADTMLASYLLNPSRRGHSLDQIAMDCLGHKTTTYAEVAGSGKQAVTFDRVPLAQAVPYACEDADVTLLAYHHLMPRVTDAGLDHLMGDVEIPLVPVLARMEMAGIGVDRDRLAELSASFESELSRIETEIYTLAGEFFNIKSSQQLGAILFEKLGLPVQKKTQKKKGYSTDMDVLTTLAPMHDLPALVLRHRTLAKLKSTYTDALMELIDPATGRIHSSFNQTVAATGRLSSSDPNLQNIPIRTEEGRRIREAFVPRPGWRFISADYSQIELRLLAHYSEDDALIAAFSGNEDIHTRTASDVFQVVPAEVTDELRRQAKAINFGIIYGMSPFGLARALGIGQKMAATYIDQYFDRYQGVKRFIDTTIAEARESGRASTLLGRIRLLPDIQSTNRTVRQFAERTAVNTPIQGTAADLIKLAMIGVDRAFIDQGLDSVLLLSVHDELVVESPESECEHVAALVAETMETVWDLRVPLTVDVGIGDNWSVIH